MDSINDTVSIIWTFESDFKKKSKRYFKNTSKVNLLRDDARLDKSHDQGWPLITKI